MDKYSVDFTNLETKIDSPKAYKLADVKHLIQKVAFDVVRFRENEDTQQLWKIEDSADGPMIVAMYDSVETEKVAEASAKEWDAVVDGSSNINIFYKGEAVKKIASADVGTESDVTMMSRWIPSKLASDSNFRSALLKDMSSETREMLLSKYPELKG